MGGLLAILLVLFIVVLGWSAFTSAKAQQQRDFEVQGDRLVVLGAAESCFNKVAWARVQGPGDLNFRARGRRNPPTLSVTVAEVARGRSRVTLWPSSYARFILNIMWHGTLAWRKTSSVERRLSGR